MMATPESSGGKPAVATLPNHLSAAQLAQMLRHLGRCGVSHLPRAAADPPWLQQRAADGPGAAAAASSLASASPPSSAAGATAATKLAQPSTPPTAQQPVTTGQPLSVAETAAASSAAPRASSAAPRLVPLSDRYPGPPLSLDARRQHLAALQQQAETCHACEMLAYSRKHVVFGEGNPQATVCFFGEAPGADEDDQGRPFVGRSGMLLTKMIEACRLNREDCYVLNTVKCRPPGNRNPDPGERLNCRPFFEAQLEVIRPQYIVCLGLVAVQTLLETNLSIGRLRGRFHQYRDSKVLATYHPAYLLRNPAAKREAWADLKLLIADLGIDLTQ